MMVKIKKSEWHPFLKSLKKTPKYKDAFYYLKFTKEGGLLQGRSKNGVFQWDFEVETQPTEQSLEAIEGEIKAVNLLKLLNFKNDFLEVSLESVKEEEWLASDYKTPCSRVLKVAGDFVIELPYNEREAYFTKQLPYAHHSSTPNAVPMILDQKLWYEILKQGSICRDAQSNRKDLNSVYVRSEKGKMEALSTNGHFLVHLKTSIDSDKNFILAHQHIAQMQAFQGLCEPKVSIWVLEKETLVFGEPLEDQKLIFSSGCIHIEANTIISYPNIDPILAPPAEEPLYFKVKAQDIKQITKYFLDIEKHENNKFFHWEFHADGTYEWIGTQSKFHGCFEGDLCNAEIGLDAHYVKRILDSTLSEHITWRFISKENMIHVHCDLNKNPYSEIVDQVFYLMTVKLGKVTKYAA